MSLTYPCSYCGHGIDSHTADGCVHGVLSESPCLCERVPHEIVDDLLTGLDSDPNPEDPGAYHLSGEHPDRREVW